MELDLCERRDLLSPGELLTSFIRCNHRLIKMGSVCCPAHTALIPHPSLGHQLCSWPLGCRDAAWGFSKAKPGL